MALVLFTVLALAAVACWWTLTQPVRSGPSRPQLLAYSNHLRLQSDVVRIVAAGARDAAHPQGMEAAASYIAAELRAVDAEVEDQWFEVGGQRYRNVVAHIGQPGAPVVVVGAHYDAFEGLPGADDNASGVAGLLDLARVLRFSTDVPAVELVAYALEEPPYFRSTDMGSAHHAASLRQRGVAPRAIVVLESIGYFDDGAGTQELPLAALALFYPRRANFVAVVGGLADRSLARRVKAAMRAGSKLPVHSINAPALVPGIDFSDHLSYWREGYNAVMVTDTAFYRNARYHTERDLPESLDYRRLANVVDGVANLVLASGKQ